MVRASGSFSVRTHLTRECCHEPTDITHVGEDFHIRPDNARLVVRDAIGNTELFHHSLRVPEIMPRHRREQVMFDLVVETSVPHVRQDIATDVPGSQDLLAEEVHLRRFIEHRHALVVRSEDRPKVQSPEQLMDSYEEESMHPRENGEEETKVQDKMTPEEHLINPGLLDGPGQEMGHPCPTDAECRKHEKRNIEPRLVPDDPPCYTIGPFLYLHSRIGEKREVDVWIDLVAIGGCVMGIVDPQPARKTEPNSSSTDIPNAIIHPHCTDNLAMTSVMTEKTDLAVKKGKERGEDEVQPERSTHNEHCDSHRKEEEDHRRPYKEEERPTLHETSCHHLPL